MERFPSCVKHSLVNEVGIATIFVVKHRDCESAKAESGEKREVYERKTIFAKLERIFLLTEKDDFC